MAQRFAQVILEPRVGGKLMTDVSLETAGAADYVIKRDWRRDMDAEKRREGHDYFWPNTIGDFLATPGNQPFPNNVTLTTASGITRVGTTATVTFTLPHIFVEGETVVIAGADQAAYNGNFVVSNVLRLSFDITVIGAPVTPATGTITVKSVMPINLVSMARRPNGKTAVIVGTAVRLFRYYALENGAYYSTDPADYPVGEIPAYYETAGPNTPYYLDNPGEWIIIGNGFSVNGNRWETVNINGWLVFNNGVDLPHTYRVEDMETVAIYEMREQGIAAVGTISEMNGILMVGDVSEIVAEKLVENFDLIGMRRGGDILATQAGTIVTMNEKFFDAVNLTDVGQWIVYDDGTSVQITGLVGGSEETQAFVSGVGATVVNKKFNLRPKFSQTGNEFSGSITATQADGSATVTASAAFFTAGMVNKYIRYTNGWEALITGYTGPTIITVSPVAPSGGNFTALPFYIIDGDQTGYADYIITSSAPVFTAEMIGRNIILDSGIVRRIDAYISTTQVRVDYDAPIVATFGGIEDPRVYGRYEYPAFVVRTQYRIAWSDVDAPRRWGSIIPATVVAGSRTIELDYPVKSFEEGQEVTLIGGGTDGGNLTVTIIYVAGGKVITSIEPAITSTGDASVQQADVAGSIIGFDDLQDDSSGIIRMMELQGTLVIYKDTSIFLGSYTGVPERPFVFKLRKVPNGKTLYYRYTLIAINSSTHVYAGRNAFYKFDLTNQVPQEIELAEFCSDIFFNEATLDQTNNIFAADNAITKEVFVVFPTLLQDKILAYDYLHGTFSTSSVNITAAATVKKPETGVSIGETEDWFVMANAAGVVLLYGKADEVVAAWGAGVSEIAYRRETNPYTATKSDYTSTLKPGMSHFGDPVGEKDVRSYTLILASSSPTYNVGVEFYGNRNTVETPVLLATTAIPTPTTNNMIPMYFRRGYFQEQLTVTGQNNLVKILQRIWEVSRVNTAGHARRP